MANFIEQESPSSFTGGDKSLPTQRIFSENISVVNRDYTLKYGRNAMTVGPITIACGVTITIDQGSTLVVI